MNKVKSCIILEKMMLSVEKKLLLTTFVFIMVDVYLFNPEHDLALAHGTHNYTAPPFARRLRYDLRLLPAWLAPSGSCIAVPGEAPLEQDSRWLQAHQLDVTPVPISQIAALGDCRILPWGWDAALRYQLSQAGVSSVCLPSDDQLEWIRRLSHRRVTIAVNQALNGLLDLPPCPVEQTLMDEVNAFMTSHPGCYLKMPWSGSGRGIYRVIDPLEDNHVRHWIEGVLRRQGSLLCEVGLDRVQDFAIECQCRDGRTQLTGYSVFDSDFHSQFGTGRIAPMEELHRYLLGLYPALDKAVEAVLAALDGIIAPHYDGPLGVDMMIYRDCGGEMALNPCVEVNLRMTMGMVTAAMGVRHGLRGVFSIVVDDSGYSVSLSM